MTQLKLVSSIEENTKHYVEILSRAIDDCMPEPSADPTYATIPKHHSPPALPPLPLAFPLEFD